MKVQHLCSGFGLIALMLSACGGGNVTPPVALAGSTQTGTTQGGLPAVASLPVSPDEQKILEAVNAARAVARDCDSAHHFAATGPLVLNAQLSAAALAHSQDMYSNGYIEASPHSGSDGSTPQQRIEAAGYLNWTSTGENVAAGYTVGGPNDVVAAWLASPSHCVNIMNPKFREIGISFLAVKGARYNGFFTQDFGAR